MPSTQLIGKKVEGGAASATPCSGVPDVTIYYLVLFPYQGELILLLLAGTQQVSALANLKYCKILVF